MDWLSVDSNSSIVGALLRSLGSLLAAGKKIPEVAWVVSQRLVNVEKSF